jgi:hypothetical protein
VFTTSTISAMPSKSTTPGPKSSVHTPSVPLFDLLSSFWDSVNSHGMVISNHLTLYMHSWSQNQSFLQIHFKMPQEVEWSLHDQFFTF